MSKIIPFRPEVVEINADTVIKDSVGVYEEVILIGYDSEGELNVRSSGNMSHERVLWIIELFKANLMLGNYGDS